MHLGSITHPHPVTDKKVKYFHDYFHYWLNQSAWKLDGFPDSHLSLLQRIAFRLEHLQRIPPSTYEVINLYLRDPLFHPKDSFCKEGSWHYNLKTLQKKFTNSKYNKIDVQTCRTLVDDLIKTINGPEGLQDSTYFKKILDDAISYLGCPHELHKHAGEIAYCAKLLAAEFLRVGFDADDLKGINGAFRQMLSNKLNYAKRDDKFKAQFEELLRIYQEEKEDDFLFRIDNIKAPDDFHFNYGDVQLTTLNTFNGDKFLYNGYLLKHFQEYFEVKNSIIAVVRLRYKTFNEAKKRALLAIRQALGAFKYMNQKMDGIINQQIIFHIQGNEMGASSTSTITKIGQITSELLKDNNLTIPLPSVSNPKIQSQITKTANIFFQALTDEYPEDVILHFWRFWESSFNKEEKNIISNLARILVLNQLHSSQTTLGNFIYDCAINASTNDKQIVNLSYEFCRGFDIEQNGYSVFMEALKISTDYPFLKKQIKRYFGLTQEKEVARMYQFYNTLLWEYYEQRNFVMHDGTYCPQTLERLQLFIRRIVSQWWTLLFNEIEQNPNSTLEEAIENLVDRAKSVCP